MGRWIVVRIFSHYYEKNTGTTKCNTALYCLLSGMPMDLIYVSGNLMWLVGSFEFNVATHNS